MPTRKKPTPTFDPFAEFYPNVARWAMDGWIEIGPTEWTISFIRVMDIGGMNWEGKTKHASVHEAMLAADEAIAGWFEENGYNA